MGDVDEDAGAFHLPHRRAPEGREAVRGVALAAAELVFPVPGERHHPDAVRAQRRNAGKLPRQRRAALDGKDRRAAARIERRADLPGRFAAGNAVGMQGRLFQKAIAIALIIRDGAIAAHIIGKKDRKALGARRATTPHGRSRAHRIR